MNGNITLVTVSPCDGWAIIEVRERVSSGFLVGTLYQIRPPYGTSNLEQVSADMANSVVSKSPAWVVLKTAPKFDSLDSLHEYLNTLVFQVRQKELSGGTL